MKIIPIAIVDSGNPRYYSFFINIKFDLSDTYK